MDWVFETYEENDPAGYYTLHFGGPLYAIVEPIDGGRYQMYICLEEMDATVSPILPHGSLAAAQTAAMPAIMDILDAWRQQAIEAWRPQVARPSVSLRQPKERKFKKVAFRDWKRALDSELRQCLKEPRSVQGLSSHFSGKKLREMHRQGAKPPLAAQSLAEKLLDDGWTY